MKALLLTVLLAASSASVGQAYLNCDGVTAASCMSDPSLLAMAGTLLGACPGQGQVLADSLAVATTQADHDDAWTAFCTDSCLSGAAALKPEHDCCIAMFGYLKSIYALKGACQKSTVNSGRYCGAEIFPLSQVACQADNANDCGALSACEWSSDTGMCLFKPTKPILDSMCTDCNRAYFRDFATGGINSIATFSKLAPIYDYACGKIDGEYCLLTESETYGFRHVGQATAADLTNTCGASSTTNRRCLRSLTASAARGLVRNARAAYQSCNSTDAECQSTLVNTLALATALEKATATTCASDVSSGTNCMGIAGQAFAGACATTTIATGNCTGCDAEVSAAATASGCCGAVVGTSGSLISSAAPTGRLLFASIAASSQNVNMTADLRLPAAGLAQMLAVAKSAVNANGFAGVGTCPAFTGVYGAWTASAADATQCAVRPYTRSYAFTLYTSHAAFAACANKQIVLDAAVSDVAVSLGFTTAQVTSATASAAATTGDLVVTIALGADTAAEVLAMDGAINSILYLTTGREILYACPAMLPLDLASNLGIAARIVATGAPGEVAAPTTTGATTTTTTTKAASGGPAAGGGSAATPNSAPATAAVGTYGAASVAALMVAVIALAAL